MERLDGTDYLPSWININKVKKNGLHLILRSAGLIILIVLLAKAFVATSCSIPSTGMENSLYKGERVLVNKWSYGLRLPFSNTRLGKGKPQKGEIVLFNNPNPKHSATAIFKREVFISRCIGTPGDTLMLNDELMVTNEQLFSPDSKALYLYPFEGDSLMNVILKKLEIENNSLTGYQDGMLMRSFSYYEYYLLQQELKGKLNLKRVNQAESKGYPFIIPAKGFTTKVYPWNINLLCNTISRHEGKQATVRDHQLYVEGFPVTAYTFTQDYYWMASNTPANVFDSRLFGLVPETHLIGKANLIWYSPKKGRIFNRVQ